MAGYFPFPHPGDAVHKNQSRLRRQHDGVSWEIYNFGRYCQYSNFHSSYQNAPCFGYVPCASAMSVGACVKVVVAASYRRAADEMTAHTRDKHIRVAGYLVYLCSALDASHVRIHPSAPPSQAPWSFLGDADCPDHWAVCCVPCQLLDHQACPH